MKQIAATNNEYFKNNALKLMSDIINIDRMPPFILSLLQLIKIIWLTT